MNVSCKVRESWGAAESTKAEFYAVLPVESFAEMGREDTGEFSTGLVHRAGAQDLLVMLCTINLNKQLL